MHLLAFLLLLLTQAPPAGGHSAGDLASPYTDPTFGFSLRPPAGWSVSTQRNTTQDGLVLMHMVQPVTSAQSQEILLMQVSMSRSRSMGDELKNIVRLLDLEFKGLQIEAQQLQQIAGRSGGVLL